MESNPLDLTLTRLIRAAPPLRDPAGPLALTPDDWEALAGRAERTGLAALLFFALSALHPSNRPPQLVFERLRRLYLQRTLINTAICDEVARLLPAFRGRGIPLVLLKGVALVHSIYPDAGTRTLGDVDLLIRVEDQERAKALLAAHEYDDAPDLAAGFREQYESERMFVRRGERPFVLDVHWHLFNVPYFREHVALDWFWEHTVPVTISGESALMLDPPAQLIHLCAHYAFHHRTEGLRWLYDIALLVAASGAEMRWAQTIETARAFGLNAAVQFALAEGEEVWGVAPPDEARVVLRAALPTRAERMAFAALTSPQNRARIVWDIWSLPGLRAKLTYLGRSVFPEKSYMVRRYRIANPRLLPWYYVRRIADGAGYFARSLASMSAHVWRSIARPSK